MKAKPAARRSSTRSPGHHFRTFRLPPKGFDIRNASERELAVHGIPRAPDAAAHPRLRLLWEEMATRNVRFVEPRFEPMEHFHKSTVRDLGSAYDVVPEDVRTYLHLWDRRVADAKDKIFPIVLPETSTNWCGAYVKSPITGLVQLRPHSEPLRVVSGRWTVPSVSLPAAAYVKGTPVDGTYLAAVWVGIDGWKGTNDVLQAGTFSGITVSGGKVTGTSYQAWTEWFGFPSSIQSLAVSPGDLISCIVCAPFSTTHGTAIINNLTTGESAIYGIDAPAGTALVGNVAEWIAEDPGINSKQLYPLPNFGQVVFTHCSANTENVELDISAARFIDLVDSAGNTRAASYYQSASSIRCQFIK